MVKMTKIVLVTSLILGLTTSLVSANDAHTNSSNKTSNELNGLKVFAGVGVGAGISANHVNSGVRFSSTGPNAKLKLGAGIFSAYKGSTVGLQASIGIGANTLNSSLTPQYMVNLDFINLFDVGSGFVKLGYIAGVGLAVRTTDVVNSGSGSFNNSTNTSRVGAGVAISAAQAQNNMNAIRWAIYQANDDASTARNAQVQANSNLINATLTWSGQQSQLPSAIAAVNSANNNVANILGGITSAQSQFSDLNTQLQQARANQASATANLNAASNAVSKLVKPIAPDTSALQASVSAAQAAVNSAQTNYNNALRINNTPTYFPAASSCDGYFNFCNSRALAPGYYAGNNVNAARNTLNDAQAKLKNAQNALKSAQDSYLNALNAYNNNPARVAYTNAQNTINNINQQIIDLSNKVSGTQASLNEANEKLINAQKQYTDALNKKNQLASGQDALDNAKKAKDAADVAVKKATDNLNTLIAQYYAGQRAIAAAQAASTKEERPQNNTSTPNILPTVKLGLIAFFGTHQSMSLEYQYYFRNETPGIASSDLTVNYTYYF
ncbi:hypothetical protein BKH43_01060 [Helicobacter sp. 13S00401-1]|uniref:hypothetical protein n=1 Tax=Helicobacter sp. 13S00401-1 TaxID=1905758 RepID=UPI000BA6BF23|nr:hypothetical protein [Helicobacter sp. 13S00401-1]PAF51853.1 hypothetical protein BKH43_01060 [Helicobacter sp. 13S00401-1]